MDAIVAITAIAVVGLVLGSLGIVAIVFGRRFSAEIKRGTMNVEVHENPQTSVDLQPKKIFPKKKKDRLLH